MKVSSLSTSAAQIRDNNVAQSDIVETKPALKEWKLRPVSLEGKKIKGRRIPQQWIMINGTGRTATASPAGHPAHAERASQGPVCQRWVLKAPWKKDYGCLCWPSGPLPAAQVCKLLKAAELRLSRQSFFTQFTLRTRWQGWALFKGKPPLLHPPPPHLRPWNVLGSLPDAKSYQELICIYKSSQYYLDRHNKHTRNYTLVSRDHF